MTAISLWRVTVFATLTFLLITNSTCENIQDALDVKVVRDQYAIGFEVTYASATLMLFSSPTYLQPCDMHSNTR